MTIRHDNYSKFSLTGGYTQWSEWSECSKSCEAGQRTRSRTCTNPVPPQGGNDCSHQGKPEVTEECNLHSCTSK